MNNGYSQVMFLLLKTAKNKIQLSFSIYSRF
ncbi:MAG: hypothetical protein ACI8YP_000238 [Algoriphagus sp.]|jgi:hypothetical protein